MKKIKSFFGKPSCGWLSVQLNDDKQPFLYASASYAFDPFPDLVNILYDLTFSKKIKYELIIDQEGYDSVIKIKNRNKNVYIETETLRDFNRTEWNLPKYKGLFNKKQFILELTEELLKNIKENKKELNDPMFGFYIKKIKLIKILNHLKRNNSN